MFYLVYRIHEILVIKHHQLNTNYGANLYDKHTKKWATNAMNQTTQTTTQKEKSQEKKHVRNLNIRTDKLLLKQMITPKAL